MRPICWSSPDPAMPYTRVANSSGAMMERIRRRNTLLRGASWLAKCGARMPSATPAAMPKKIQAVREMRFTLPFSPFELLAQDVEEHHARRADQMQRVLRAAALHGVVLLQRTSDLAIDGEEDAFIRALRDDANHAGFRHHDRAVGEHVGTDRREENGGDRGEDDRAAGGQRISRGAGGGGDDQAVGFEIAYVLIVHVGIEIDHAGERGLGEHGVVEGIVGGDGAAVAEHFGGEQLAARDAVFAAEGALELGVDLVDGDGGQEPEAAEIDGE